MKAYDAIVIGAGVNGSAAAVHLSKAGTKTALIEQFPIPHSRGSSTGQTRVIRYAHNSNEAILPIVMDSFKQWRNLEQEMDISLMRPCPLLVVSGRSNFDQNDQVQKSIEKTGGKALWKDNREVNNEYSTSFPPESLILEDSRAGILMADKCVLSLHKKFISLGGTLIDEWPVTNVSVTNDGSVLVRGKRGELKAQKLVICAGPWTSKLLEQLGLHLPLRPTKVKVLYWPLRDTFAKRFSFINFNPKFEEIYGLPSIEYPGLVKICYHDGIDCSPDSRDSIIDHRSIKEVATLISEYFPSIEPSPAIEESCMYTMTPDHEMILDTHPRYKNIAYGCGFSGTGFKSAPTVGQILSQMVLGSAPSFDVSAFKSDRFLNHANTSKL